MKRVDELENMSFWELESIADNESVDTPAILDEKISTALTASAWMEQNRKSKKKTDWPLPAAVLATVAFAAGIVIFLTNYREPSDTFNDPVQAYAQIEKTFSTISARTAPAMELVSKAEQSIGKTTDIFR